MQETYRVEACYGHKELNIYELPPLIVITECPIEWTLSKCAGDPEKRKYTAAQIILGQPFNRNKKYACS